MTTLGLGPPPAPTSMPGRQDCYPEGNELPFRFLLFHAGEQLPAMYAGPHRIAATYLEQAPHTGYLGGTASAFATVGMNETVSLVIPADYAERVHLLPGEPYQIIAQIIINWPDAYGLIITQGEDLIFQGISDWRLDASLVFACLSPIRVEQIGILVDRYREGDQCSPRFTNTGIRFSSGREAVTLHQGESAKLADYDIGLEIARVLDRTYCPDAGATNISYTIAKRSPAESGVSERAIEDTEAGLPTTAEVTIADANLESYLRGLANKDAGPLLASDLEGLRCFVRLYPVDWDWESAPSHGQVANLSGLEHARHLEAIYLGGSGSSDFSPLGNLGELTRLLVDHNQLADLPPLQNLTSLTDLVAGNNQVSDLAPLSSLVRLSHLSPDDKGITDISPLSSLANLTELSLYKNQIADISSLSELAHLRRLRLDANRVADVAALSRPVNLVELSMDQNQVVRVSPLSPLVDLVDLSLWQNRVADIAALSSLVNLAVLDPGENRVRDISAQEHLTSLRLLNLDENEIVDIAPLVRNPGLGEGDWVQLSETPLSDDSANRWLPLPESRGVMCRGP